MGSIQCGRCHELHASVQEVRDCYNEIRDCYNGGTVAGTPQAPAEMRTTEKQVNFINKLLKKQHKVIEPEAHLLERRVGSWLIDHLLGKGQCPAGVRVSADPAWQSADGNPQGYGEPRACGEDGRSVAGGAVPKPSLPDVPAGHYAVVSATGNNDLDFYRVDRPTEGRWAGYVFVKRVIGGHPDQPVCGSERVNALVRIEQAGVHDAAHRYGQELGRCYRCNRHLTDETSRELSIGPECRSKAGVA